VEEWRGIFLFFQATDGRNAKAPLAHVEGGAARWCRCLGDAVGGD
jgi:hypothetical protein